MKRYHQKKPVISPDTFSRNESALLYYRKNFQLLLWLLEDLHHGDPKTECPVVIIDALTCNKSCNWTNIPL